MSDDEYADDSDNQQDPDAFEPLPEFEQRLDLDRGTAVDREDAPPHEEASGADDALLQPHASFDHAPPSLGHARTREQLASETPPRLRATGVQADAEVGAVGSPVDRLAQSIGGASSVNEDIDVSTEALIEETLERLSFVHGVQARHRYTHALLHHPRPLPHLLAHAHDRPTRRPMRDPISYLSRRILSGGRDR
jgi:hypothetical protein